MLENCSCRTGCAEVRPCAGFLRTLCLAFLLSTLLLPAAQAQKSGGQAKPLPAKSQPIAFYTPEGQQQIADAILTEAVEQLSEQADDHYDRGEYNHSINLLRVVVQGNPRKVDAFADAAYLLWSTGQNEPGISVLKQGLAANPDNYYMYDELGGFYYYRLKDYPNAVTYYEKAIKFNCPFFTWSALAHSYEKMDRWDKAVKAWEQAANFVSKGGDSETAKPDKRQAQMDHAIGENMKHNLARARAELAKRQK